MQGVRRREEDVRSCRSPRGRLRVDEARVDGGSPTEAEVGGRTKRVDPATRTAKVRRGFTIVRLKVEDLNRAAAGTHLGAHVHVGPCVAGNGGAALAHYNASTATPPVISDQTEVWLDFEISRKGKGRAEAVVPFVIPPGGAMSVVIHALQTNPDDGLAGPRWACLPVQF